jgi:Ala-tRNA(Pro) deacylase
MPNARLQHFLDQRATNYATIRHPESFTAQETAAVAHVPGRELVKTVMVKLDGRLVMVVTDAAHRIDLEQLCAATGARRAELAQEYEFKQIFPDCELGAMPPFGNLYDIEVYADTRLAEDAAIVFPAGSHTELLQMPYGEFERLVCPKTVSLNRVS